MKRRNDITALVTAAGYSSRMERFKPLLPVGDISALERCVGLFRDAGIHDVSVVIGHRASELQPTLDRLAVRSIMNDRFTDGMFSSIKAGVKEQDSTARAFFLLPVDIPLIRHGTIQDLLAALDAHPPGVLIPTFLGKRGHPPLISTSLCSELLAWEGDGGLRAFFNSDPSRVSEVPTADEHILMDMDTPEDYEKLLSCISDFHIPSEAECIALLTEKFRVKDSVTAHSRKVAQVALNLTSALNAKGCRLNTKLITAAALLHDLAKGEPNHAAMGAKVLTELGYSDVGEITALHIDIPPQTGMPISPAEVVCFADKLVQGDRIVSLETRFSKRLSASENDSDAVNAAARRFSNALGMKERLEKVLRSSIESVLSSNASNSEDDTHADLSL